MKLDPNLFVSAVDLSVKAIEFVKKHEMYDEKRCDVYACDITKHDLPRSISNRRADNVLLLFVLSAIAPNKMLVAMRRAVSVLKSGGHFFFRDYGRGDHAQLRFKDNGHKLEENFYARNDGTRAYYFTVDEIRRLFCLVGLSVVKLEYIRRTDSNKKTGVSWDRVWIQGTFVKG
jgi:methyltransferase-like protein 6